MKVTGFTFIKNAIKYDYPIVEAIQSVLPLCDDFVVAVGKSDDDTLALIQSISPDKIKIIETVWDETKRVGGQVLAIETDKAFQAITSDSDWAFYIQGDEVIHEKYHAVIKENMLKYKEDQTVDGLLFKYLHFYGSYDYVVVSSNFYKHEIRVIKNNKKIYSYRDAQGFRKNNNEKLQVKLIDAYVYHYGWVKEPKAMQEKQKTFQKLWHDDEWVEQNVVKSEEFDYESHISELAKFTESHPLIMRPRIEKKSWKFEHDISFNRRKLKDYFKAFLLKGFGIDLNYKNYKKI
jgi:hypothetical protein